MSTSRKQTKKPTPATDRLPVLKTYKLYIGGKFPRSESGRSLQVLDAGGRHVANAAWASRKDARDAVKAARSAQKGWAAATAYNRGQVLYRVAEMLEGRRDQFVAELRQQGHSAAAAGREVDQAIDLWVYYAGFADKYAQVIGCANPVAAPYFNFSVPEPTGVVAVVVPTDRPLLELARTVAPAIVSGNTCVVAVGEAAAMTAISFAEVLATSDVPGGVVNVLTGPLADTAPTLAAHMDVNALDLAGADPDELRELELAATENLKRVVRPGEAANPATGSLAAIERLVELKTVWHPIGV